MVDKESMPCSPATFSRGGGHFFLLCVLLVVAHHGAHPFAGLFTFFNLLLALELAAANDVPRGQGHAEVASHGNDFALEVAGHDVPSALVDAEGGLAV